MINSSCERGESELVQNRYYTDTVVSSEVWRVHDETRVGYEVLVGG